MKKLVLAVLAAFSLVSCQKVLENEAEKNYELNETAIQNYITTNKLTMQKSASGLYYNITKSNPNGTKPNIGDEVAIHYVLFKMSGAKFDSTERLKNTPFAYTYGVNALIPGMDEGISMMRKGERALFLMNHYLAFGSQSDAILPAYSAVGADVEIVKVRSEEQQIEDYIQDKKLTLTEKTSSGLRFIQTSTTTNAQVKSGDIVLVKYTGKLLTDKQFDTGEIQVRVGAGSVIKGFDEGISKLRIGEKATLIFPSSLGYGTQGSGSAIRPYAPLLFEVEIVK
jgi:FKBP-type peptidyl-prolyl cis-trans isomerase